MHSRNCGGAVRPVKQYLFPPASFFFPSFLHKNAIATGDGRGTLIHARIDGKYRYFSDKYGYLTSQVRFTIESNIEKNFWGICRRQAAPTTTCPKNVNVICSNFLNIIYS